MYQLIAEDSRFLKRQQWVVTYYILILYAAVVGFASVLGFFDQTATQYLTDIQLRVLSLFLAVAVTCAGVAGIWYIVKSHCTLNIYRKWAKIFGDPKSQKIASNYKLSEIVGKVIFSHGDKPSLGNIDLIITWIAAITLGWLLLIFVFLRRLFN